MYYYFCNCIYRFQLFFVKWVTLLWKPTSVIVDYIELAFIVDLLMVQILVVLMGLEICLFHYFLIIVILCGVICFEMYTKPFLIFKKHCRKRKCDFYSSTWLMCPRPTKVFGNQRSTIDSTICLGFSPTRALLTSIMILKLNMTKILN